MSRPVTKPELLSAAVKKYEEMNKLISSLSEKELETEPEAAEELEERSKEGLFHKIVNYFKIDLDTFIEEEEDFC